jgi:DNA uptake protein ComE-like DNA-binding protein
MIKSLLTSLILAALLISPLPAQTAAAKKTATKAEETVKKAATKAEETVKKAADKAEKATKPEKADTADKTEKPAKKPSASAGESEGDKALRAHANKAKLTAAQQTKLLDLVNKGTDKELQTMPGVGEVKATAVKKARPIKSLEDLIMVDGIGETTFDGIIDWTKKGMPSDAPASDSKDSKPTAKADSKADAKADKAATKSDAKEKAPAGKGTKGR